MKEQVRFFCWVFLVAQTFLSVFALAQGFSDSDIHLSMPRKGAKPDELGIGISTESLLTRERPVGGSADEQRLLFHARATTDSNTHLGAGVDLNVSTAPGNGRETMEEVPEAFVRWTSDPFDKNSSIFILGRKLESWSRLDHEWTLGEWQPLNRFDSLRPTEQGMSGFFVATQSGEVEAVLYASPIFLPEQGPGYHLEDGHFQSTNPWFAEPTDKIVLFSKPTSLHYSIDMPTADSVINHPEGGLIIRYGDLKGPGGNFQFAYAKKPRNQISLPFNGIYDINQNVANIQIKPIVEYQDLASFDTGYRSIIGGVPFNFTFSGLYDGAISSDAPIGTTYQVFAPLVMLSPSIEARLFPHRFWGPLVKVSGLHSIGGDVTVKGPLATGTSPFAPRTMYREAMSVDVRSRLWKNSTGWKIDQGVHWIEEFEEQGSIVMVDLTLADRNKWRIAGYFDILASRQSQDVNPGFISRFRGNDRVGSQFLYFF